MVWDRASTAHRRTTNTTTTRILALNARLKYTGKAHAHWRRRLNPNQGKNSDRTQNLPTTFCHCSGTKLLAPVTGADTGERCETSLSQITKRARLVALCVSGRTFSSKPVSGISRSLCVSARVRLGRRGCGLYPVHVATDELQWYS